MSALKAWNDPIERLPSSDRETGRHLLQCTPRLTAVIELAGFFAIFAFLEFSVFGPGTIARWEPHPFWIPVILLSLQYGTVDGLLAAGVAVLCHLLLGWPPQGVNEAYYAYLHRVWINPVMWIGAAILIGVFRNRQLERQNEMSQDLNATLGQLTAITGHCDQLKTRTDTLERHIACQDDGSLAKLLAALEGLRARDASEFFAALSQCAGMLLGNVRFSLYIRANAALRLVTHGGDGSGTDRGPALYRQGEPLFDAIVEGRRSLSAFRPSDAAALDGHAVFAAAIQSGPRGRAIGMLTLDALPGGQLPQDLERKLQFLCSELATALGVRDVQDLLRSARPDDERDPDARPTGARQRNGRRPPAAALSTAHLGPEPRPAAPESGASRANGERTARPAGGDRNGQDAEQLYLKAAEEGDVNAFAALGRLYAEGRSVRQDLTAAEAWYRKAAERGDSEAQFALGRMYAKGKGVDRDAAQAAGWYRRAAEQGNTRAQVALGEMYMRGTGVAKNYAEAAKWYLEAAEQGDEEAHVNLGLLRLLETKQVGAVVH